MYGSIKELTELAKKESVPIWKIILDTEMKITECSEEQVYDKLDKRYEVMYKSVHKALQEPQVITGNLISGSAKKQYEYSEQQDTLGGFLINHIMALALSASEVNASMGKICAAPTAGSCGILPAVIIGVSEHYGLSRKDTLNGLLTASGIGTITAISSAVINFLSHACFVVFFAPLSPFTKYAIGSISSTGILYCLLVIFASLRPLDSTADCAIAPWIISLDS